MQSKEKDIFLDEVVKYVKFTFDRAEIRKELEDHILDCMEYHMESGCSQEEAVKLSIQGMGDAREIGKALNKEHNPFVGWMLRITNVLVGIFVLASIFIVFIPLIFTIFNSDPYGNIDKNDIVYEIDVNQKVQIDDVVIEFTKLVYDKEGDMNIFYKSYDKKLWGAGWSTSSIGEIYDESGNKYFNGGGCSSNGIISKTLRSIRDFPPDAKELIIIYDSLDRYYEVRIPLKDGDSHE